jgi:SAM-dependent methyltransferase
MRVITPVRRRGVEYLDDPGTPDAVRERSLRDVTRSNALFGGTHAVLAEAAAVFRMGPRWGLGSEATLLDIGTGLGDIPTQVAAEALTHGVTLTTVGLDAAETLARASRDRLAHVVCGNGLALPFAARSFDVVTCSQLLHHFSEDDGVGLLREINRVARCVAIVGDLRRSWLAVAGFWLASFPLCFHRVTRHDGVVSILRGFTRQELTRLLSHAVPNAPAVVRHRVAYRVTAVWPGASTPSRPW